MSGHSKWSTIKRKKGAADAARGKLFTKMIKEITIAARIGGGDPNGNPRLRLAVQQAKSKNMPIDNITRAIKKGTGELEGVHYEEIVYEVYGPGGVAIIVDSATDNKNRTVAELRHLISRNGGNLAESGSVSWNFERKGVINVPKGNYSEDDILNVILDAGADDLVTEDEFFQITTKVEHLEPVRKAIESSGLAGIKIESASLQFVPKQTVRVEGKDAEHTMKLIAALEDNDDVQNVYTNADIDEKIMAEFS
ncbi:MAG: YebC/PmpR family DNA-binding transcriptional regulator [Ignavibacteriae bacterium]|nr:MAG: YebC/PmpR family DNA-binding transcriptional regulator [Ignavibacteriota bacterium]